MKPEFVEKNKNRAVITMTVVTAAWIFTCCQYSSRDGKAEK